MTAALHKRYRTGYISTEQAAFANRIRHRSNVRFSRNGVKIFSGSMFYYFIHLFRQFYLLNYKPFIKRFKAFGVFIFKLVFNDFIYLLRLKRSTRKFSMPMLATSLTFSAAYLNNSCFGLYNVTRRRLRRVTRIFLQPSNFLFQPCNSFFECSDFCSLLFYNSVFVHKTLIGQNKV